ncbi:MAG: ATP-dependent DNA helicase RecG [Clostridia bacterium]|nr:ATP-dependent DNA helicase RecG [Clostridia bacterium]
MKLAQTDIRVLKGIGDAKAKQLLRLGVHTLWDLLTYYPMRFEDRTKLTDIFSLEDESFACVNAKVVTAPTEHYVRKGLTYYKFSVRDESGIMNITFFNNKYIKNYFKIGKMFTFYGKASIRGSRREMVSPEFEEIDSSESTKVIVPVYSLTSGLTQKFLRKIVKEAYEISKQYIEDFMPSEITKEYQLCSLDFAIKNIHFPSDSQSLAIARKRLIFEEFFILQTALRKTKQKEEKTAGVSVNKIDLSPFLSRLNFSLTPAQKRVVDEILSDISGKYVMNRLVQGDVGSGKTVIAAIAMYVCAKNNLQSAMMVPTEVLARQHYNDLSKILNPLGIKTALLTGSTPQKEKKEIYEKLKNNEINVVFGTHALITDKTEFNNLALAITDEQHRFGVRQRLRLAQKGKAVHTLYMTATPIPRSLALIIYGDMDISLIDELPPGRQKVDTFCVGEDMRQRIHAFIKKEISSGNQAYIVCPAVEENEEIPIKSVTDIYANLKEKIFPDIPIGIVHGKMKPKEKEAEMNKFVSGETKILVATTVIEVGVNVPKATLMVIENSERFGLSQLHQLRGRVGRGKNKSYCILFCELFNKEIKERMNIMVKSSNGFDISEKDLELRGPGDFFGVRQHGLPALKIASFSTDLAVLKESGKASEKMLSDDPDLKKQSHIYIRKKIESLTKDLTM